MLRKEVILQYYKMLCLEIYITVIYFLKLQSKQKLKICCRHVVVLNIHGSIRSELSSERLP